MWKVALEVWRVGLIGGKERVIGHCQGWWVCHLYQLGRIIGLGPDGVRWAEAWCGGMEWCDEYLVCK